MKAPSTKIRFAEAQKLLDYGFSTYSYSLFAKKGDVLKQIPINKGTTSNIDIVYGKDCGAVISKGNEKNLVQNIKIENSLNAPVYKGEKIGEITYSLDNEIISTIPLIANETVEKNTLKNISTSIFKKWFTLLRN